MLKYNNVHIYMKNGDSPNTYMCTYYVLSISLHQAHVLLNIGEAELTIP